MSSPALNNVILAGCVLMYSEIINHAVTSLYFSEEKTGEAVCMVRKKQHLFPDTINVYMNLYQTMTDPLLKFNTRFYNSSALN